ncbi:S8 family peptidase [Hyalangium rubrum]|uniref:S8 family peptidase n=1 Tax=Hyalangium rubrum TaxID=3103134 RepID=A0ABU5H8D7_9BACT|nr:S8 family peptidase [Hyalangium sp. s54d21]MDY7228355.1 S8 family peptidase [Hyalangium sp. s54d21]
MKLKHVVFMTAALLGGVEQANAASSPAYEAPLIRAQGEGIEGQYIVVLNEGADPGIMARGVQIAPLHVYNRALVGFAAKLSSDQLSQLRKDSRVKYLEQDQVVRADATQLMDANGDPWGLDRIDQRNLPLNGQYTYTSTAPSVTAYVIDTGILTSHVDFGGTATNVFDAFGGTGQDCNGHGTHVAATIGGATHGVAKNVSLRGVKVLDCNGSGSFSGVIAGINFVQANAVAPAVANLSLGGGYSAAVNAAVTSLSNSGVFVAVAAGNNNANACNYSPASTPEAYTTAASTKTDARATYSNYGTCVDGYAPGTAIKSAWHTTNTATNIISGTSMASPHVAGCAALYKQQFGNQPSATVASAIAGLSTPNKITGNPAGTPNKLLFCGADVWSKDKPVDTGNEPDAATASLNMWESDDIWNSLSASGPSHQNPEFGQSNYLHVRLRNRGLTQGGGPVTFYYANASTGLGWSGSWTPIGTFNTPPINPNSSPLEVVMPWTPPATGHYCILVRYTGEPMAYAETADVNYNTRQNNNIVWRNMNIVDLVAGPQLVKFIVRNILRRPSSMSLRLQDSLVGQVPFSRHGVLTAYLPPELHERWLAGGGRAIGLKDMGRGWFQVVTTDAEFQGIALEPGEAFTVELEFRATVPTTQGFKIDAIQFDKEQVEPIGGVTYQVRMPSK